MTTFSQMVDELVLEHLRPDLKTSICAYLNQTIREVHSDKNGIPILFNSNRNELDYTVTVLPVVWPIPSVPRFQKLDTAYYPESGRYAKERALSRAYDNGVGSDDAYWYRSGQNIVFNGVLVGNHIYLAWFEFPRQLLYYAVADRPATYDVENDSYTYLPAYDVDATTREDAVNKTDNWLLTRWPEMMKQGVRSKIFSRLGEDVRAKTNYSLYESQRAGLIGSEQYNLNG
jgi:hypothetical protein